MRFRRALDRKNITEALSAASEPGFVGLAEALELTLLLADKEPEKYDRAAACWHVRFVYDSKNVDLRESLAVLALLAAVPATRLAANALAELLSRRRSCERIAEALIRWSRVALERGKAPFGALPQRSCGQLAFLRAARFGRDEQFSIGWCSEERRHKHGWLVAAVEGRVDVAFSEIEEGRSCRVSDSRAVLLIHIGELPGNDVDDHRTAMRVPGEVRTWLDDEPNGHGPGWVPDPDDFSRSVAEHLDSHPGRVGEVSSTCQGLGCDRRGRLRSTRGRDAGQHENEDGGHRNSRDRRKSLSRHARLLPNLIGHTPHNRRVNQPMPRGACQALDRRPTSPGVTSGTPSSASSAFCRRTPASMLGFRSRDLVLEALVPFHPMQVPEQIPQRRRVFRERIGRRGLNLLGDQHRQRCENPVNAIVEAQIS